jgi:hypothetical protein
MVTEPLNYVPDAGDVWLAIPGDPHFGTAVLFQGVNTDGTADVQLYAHCTTNCIIRKRVPLNRLQVQR